MSTWVQGLGQVDIVHPLAFAGAVHVGTTEDREEVGLLGELVIRELYRTHSLWLSIELLLRVGDGIDPVEEDFSGKASGVEA